MRDIKPELAQRKNKKGIGYLQHNPIVKEMLIGNVKRFCRNGKQILITIKPKKMTQSFVQRAKKAVAALALGLILAQGLVLISTKASASVPPENGSCAPATSYVCGLNGTNYEDKLYLKGGVE
ncbi:MAG TPA: hypothetical protein VFN30_07495 [Chitinophagaceae bacterium]|nr:hypothetical protein [Chitinophagaceae bacterium]